MLTWKVGVRGLLWLVQLSSSWCRGKVPPEVPQVTSGGQTPEELVCVPVVLCLASHNVGPDEDELNLDDPEEEDSKGGTRCDSSPV
ncbi:hypothetical protein TIFTF001_017467 [Ficus carica]|uniref:Secreted protein n=1 Tax=Ficus carica TaxID=3494 RepID=A0AA88D9S1_FICCA|nr:hypothetical protein TIFTF001_017467 [Ficus carica]